MSIRALEILFRHKILLTIPFLIIIPITAWLAFRLQQPHWQASARIWVQQDSAVYTDPLLGSTPAASQAALLKDFLHSRSFAMDVLTQTHLGPSLRTQSQIDTAFAHFTGDWVDVEAVSNNFVSIVVTTPDRQLSYQTIQAILSTYQSTVQAQKQALSDTAVNLYGNSLQQAQDVLTQAQNSVSAYLVSHPALASRSADSGGAAAGNSASLQDPVLGGRLQELSNAEATYNSLRDHYFSARSAGVLNGTFAPFAFNVVDRPQEPTRPIVVRRLELLKLPLIGAVIAALVSAAVGSLLVLSNHSILGAFDLQGALDVPLLGEIPTLRTRGPKASGVVRSELLRPARNENSGVYSRHQIEDRRFPETGTVAAGD